ncbi:MAG: NAD(P)-binding domain-containing protein [Bacteroidota bacterium]
MNKLGIGIIGLGKMGGNLASQALEKDINVVGLTRGNPPEALLQKGPHYIEDTAEVNWLVDDAMHMEVPVHIIAQSVMQLFASRDENKNWARAIAMMRHGFGGHPYGAEESIQKGREKGRVGGFYSE